MRLLMMITLSALLYATLNGATFAQEKTQGTKALESTTKANAAEPSVDEILDKYVKAIGGRQAVEKVTSRVIKSSFEISSMGLTGEAEQYSKAPNKSLRIQNVSGMGEILG